MRYSSSAAAGDPSRSIASPSQVVTRAFGESLIEASGPLDGIANDRDRVGDPAPGQIQLSETQQDMAPQDLHAAALQPAQSPNEQFFGML